MDTDNEKVMKKRSSLQGLPVDFMFPSRFSITGGILIWTAVLESTTVSRGLLLVLRSLADAAQAIPSRIDQWPVQRRTTTMRANRQ